MQEMRFDGKVVIVTGAGRGLGREYALLLASRGAKVVVNDLGVAISDTDGSGEAPAVNPADEVVAEIVAGGGEAVANHDTIATPEGGAAIVSCAVDTFGSVDVVVNNAGQVRMQPFPDFPEDHLDTVIDTQLRGTLNVSRPAWRAMAESGGGRFVNVSSGAAYGGFDRSSVYSMAKAGAIGLTIAMATEGAPVGIVANVVAPYAKTRSGTGFGPIPWSEGLAEWLHPRKVAPVVAWLAHDSCESTGECYAVGGGHVARVAFAVNDGYTDRDMTPESVAAHAAALAAPADRPVGGPESPLMPNMMGGFTG
jgi:NAD(P)-dependent dehydrogenase (short-subunit alcohol dehydrogenase family)